MIVVEDMFFHHFKYDPLVNFPKTTEDTVKIKIAN